MPNSGPFSKKPPFLAHNIFAKNVVGLFRAAKIAKKLTTVLLGYAAYSVVGHTQLLGALDRHIDFIPMLHFLQLTVLRPVIDFATRDVYMQVITDNAPQEVPLIMF